MIYKISIVVFLLYFMPVVLIDNNEKYSVTDSLYILGSTVFLGVAYNSMILISNIGINYLIYLLLITTLTDTFAYFTGYFIGRHKLCEKISPNKTIEGAVGGVLIGTAIPTLFYLYMINSDINIFVLTGITFVLSIIGQIGDLFFSSIKRHYEIKDFSNLIPGHGGILDRLDSIIFVVITFVLFMNIL
jgi:phosphatidate cytidylyltransferase